MFANSVSEIVRVQEKNVKENTFYFPPACC